MSDERAIPATPEEYRKMLDSLGLFTMPRDNGFDCVFPVGSRWVLYRAQTDKSGWWEFRGPSGIVLVYGAYVHNDTRDAIQGFLRTAR